MLSAHAIPGVAASDRLADAALLKRVAQGDTLALAQLRQQYHPRLSSYIRRRVGDAHLAEEVEQDLWLAVWQQAGGFRGESRLSTWLLRIAHHKAMGALRRRWPEPMEQMPELSADPAHGPEAHLERIEQRMALRRAMATLSPIHRATLDLVFGQGLSLQETADVMEVPLGTVKSRLSYARKYMAKALEGVAAEGGVGGESRL